MSAEVKVIAITGGPCAGKSTVMSIAQEKLPGYGWDVYVAEESATVLGRAGVQFKQAIAAGSHMKLREYQAEIMRHCWESLQRLKRCAELEDRRAVILCDRGIPDTLAYLPEGSEGFNTYRNLLGEICSLDEAKALDLYKAVIKLTTAALGAEEFYTTANNAVRNETPEMARYLDKRIEHAYLDHGHLRVIDNGTDFEQKKRRAFKEICRSLGIPAPIEIEKKYEIDYPCFQHFPVQYRTAYIEQAYLHSANPREELRIRERSLNGGSTYHLTKKRILVPGERIEVEESISWRAYEDLKRSQKTRTLQKMRHYFLWENQYFELDVFKNLDRSLVMLEIELTNIRDEVRIPPFIKVVKDVTMNPDYSNSALALRVKSE